tara:strand:- start:1377 stop:1679 length:303 start_codon:yes stop_codon:yes gene_type:complete
MTETLPTQDSLPHTGGTLVAASQCLAQGDSHLWVVLAHYPNRGQWWATEGEWWCWLYNTASASYIAGVQESGGLRAIDLFADRLKQYIRRYIDGSQTNEE